MRKLLNRKRGFTLIELMIVVAIIGILAAIAIPNFLRFQLRSKTGEARTNLAAIRTAEESYFAEYGTYVGATDYPGALLTSKQVWTPATTHGFEIMGWAPEGSVFYSYAVGTNNADYMAVAAGDLDGDTTTSDFAYIHPVPGAAAASTVPAYSGAGCAATGVYNAVTTALDVLNAVGGCAQLDGQSQF